MKALAPVAAGLTLALAGPVLLALSSEHCFAGADAVTLNLAAQLTLWALLGGVVAITLGWERRPLASLGVRPLRSASLAWGVAAAAALVWVVVPLSSGLVDAAGLAGFEEGLARVLALPLWLRVLAVVTGGVVEEVLYRGYAITRLELVTHSRALAAALSVLVFAAAHAPLWGPGPVISFAVSGGFLAAFFLWRRDLLANVVAHVAVDALGIVAGAAAAGRSPAAAAGH